MTKSSSGANRVSDCQSILVTTPSSRWVLEKPKIEVTKALIHHIGKNGEHFYGENFIHEYPESWRHIKSNQNMGTHHTFNNCIGETFNHGTSPSEIDCGDVINAPIKHGPNYTSNGCTLMEVDWGDKLKLNYTSYGCMLMEIDWGGKVNCTSCGCPMANWQGYEHTQLDTTPQKLIGSLGFKLILWLLEKLEMIFSTPHQLTHS